MTIPDRQDRDFGPEHFAGWPATVPTERLERAIQYVQDRTKVQPNMQELPSSGDNNLNMDMFLTAQSMNSAYYPTEVDLTALDEASDTDWLEVLRKILQDLETEHHFACAIITATRNHEPGPAATIMIQHIFKLARHPDWMGLSILLPYLRGHHVHTWESGKHRVSPCTMIAVPDIMMPENVYQPPAAPEGGIQVLAGIAAWHGAASFHWFPPQDQS